MKKRLRRISPIVPVVFLFALAAGAQANSTNSTPVITLLGNNPLTNECHTAFNDPGVTANSGPVDLTSRIVVRSAFNPDILSTYTLYYSVSDDAGNTATATRSVIVVDTTPPVLTLNGPDPVVVACPEDFTDPGATATDPCVGPAAIAADLFASLVLKSDGTVVAWGDNSYGQMNVVAIAIGTGYSLALRGDGTVIAWGDNNLGQTDVPASATNVVAIAAGAMHGLALKSDGTVVAWGDNFRGQTDVPAGATNVVAVAASWVHSLALRSDGTVVAWGYNCCGQTDIPASATDVVAIAADGWHSLALRSDGTVVAWGCWPYWVTDVVPASATNVVAIDAGCYHDLALKSDGTVIAWGEDTGWGELDVPASVTNVVAIAAGWYHNLALRSDGTVIAWGRDNHGQTDVPAGLSDDLSNRIQITGTPLVFGTNILTYTVSDPSGNLAITHRTVVVRDPRGELADALAELIALRGESPGRPDGKALDSVIKSLTDAVDSKQWQDDGHPHSNTGGKVFSDVQAALRRLADLRHNKKRNMPYATLQSLMDRIVAPLRLIAVVKLDEAKQAGINRQWLAAAENLLAKGDAQVAKGAFKVAALYYKFAWYLVIGIR